MLEFRKVCSGYEKNPVLQDLSMSLLPGKITAIGGLNGCGKSTLLKTAAALLPVQRGELLLDGTPLASLSPQQRARRLAYLPQSRNVPDLTAFRMVLHGRFPHLSFPRRYRKEDVEIAQAALNWVGSRDLAQRNMSTLSGGQRQKIYIAMALAQNADIILMDEPTTYLDIRASFELMELIQRLAGSGKAIAIVLHDLNLLLRYAHWIVLLADGRLTAQGTSRQLCDNKSIDRVFGVTVTEMALADGNGYVFQPLPSTVM